MDQRMFLAVGLSMLVILGFYLIVPTPVPPPPKPATVIEGQAGNPATTAAAGGPAGSPSRVPGTAPTAQTAPAAPARMIEVQTPRYTASIDTRGGVLTSFVLKAYKLDKNSYVLSDLIPPLESLLPKPKIDPTAHVQMVKRRPNGQLPLGVVFAGDQVLTQAFAGVVFSSVEQNLGSADPKTPGIVTLTGTGPNGITVRKIVTFHPESYVVDYELQVINYGAGARPLHVLAQFGLGPDTAHAQTSYGHLGPMFRSAGKIEKEDADDIKEVLPVKDPQWLAMNDAYFIAAAAPAVQTFPGFYSLVPGVVENKLPVPQYGFDVPDVNLEPQKMIGSKFKLYLGPKNTEEMLKFGGKLEESLDLTLDFIASPMLAMLRWFHSYVGNYGVAIILLTCVVRIVLFPLTYKGMVTMKRMGKLQPKIASMRERLKNDKERMNREMMEMYRKYRINPLSGCLPILLQIPIFFALYSALLGAIELRHEPFIFWITDLSAQDGLYVLPLLMGVSMFFQQKLTPTSLDPMQAKIMMWMPVVFTFFMLNFPAGLTLYWCTSNALSIAQQLIINRVQVPDFAD